MVLVAVAGLMIGGLVKLADNTVCKVIERETAKKFQAEGATEEFARINLSWTRAEIEMISADKRYEALVITGQQRRKAHDALGQK